MRKLNKIHAYILATMLLVIISFHLSAQEVNFDRVIAPQEQRPANFEDYLVQLAYTNTQQKSISILEQSIADNEVLLAKRAWMDDVSFSFNLNEVSLENILDEDKSDNIVINPLYNFVATVRLSTFFSNPKKSEIAEAKAKIIDLEGKQKMLEIRRLTLATYQKFLLAQEIEKIRVEGEESSLTNYNFASERFQSGDLGLEDLIRAQESHQRSMEQRLNAQAQSLISKYELEELIGIKWEIAARNKK